MIKIHDLGGSKEGISAGDFDVHQHVSESEVSVEGRADWCSLRDALDFPGNAYDFYGVRYCKLPFIP